MAGPGAAAPRRTARSKTAVRQPEMVAACPRPSGWAHGDHLAVAKERSPGRNRAGHGRALASSASAKVESPLISILSIGSIWIATVRAMAALLPSERRSRYARQGQARQHNIEGMSRPAKSGWPARIWRRPDDASRCSAGASRRRSSRRPARLHLDKTDRLPEAPPGRFPRRVF